MSRRKSRFRSRSAESSSAGPRPERAPREQAAPVTPATLAEQYRYVIGDLQRVGIISLLLIGVMVLLRIFVIK